MEELKYDFSKIEKKWQKKYEELKVFESEPDPSKPKFFVTFPFPYMSGPVHLGTAYTLTRLDVIARYKRKRGFNVLFPFAFHWTGTTIAGISDRIRRGDQKTIEILEKMDGVPRDEIERFKDPVYLARYYTEKNRTALKDYGLAIDWRREFHTTSLNAGFSTFVRWQYLKLLEKGYIKKGVHPVVWCPRDKSPTGDHDRLSGEGVFPEKFYLVKFRLEESHLVAATFRPETVFGVTNVWVNPEATYAEAYVDGEKWIVSLETLEKLADQLRSVTKIRELKGRELVGKRVTTVFTGVKVPVLPASFVDPSIGTGIVYSVPAHAPYDYMALEDLKHDESLLREYGLDPEEIRSIKPISMITTEKYGSNPSEKVVKELGIKDQSDPKLEEATSLVYKEEFHKGVTLDNCGRFSNLPVQRAKELVIEEMKNNGAGDEILELPSPVVCRCGTRCRVKILSDQYLLAYSSPEWKAKALKALEMMKIYPKEARENFVYFINWYVDWAFTRTSGLGTPVPWLPDQMIETLSDSTVYMAYYIVSKYVNNGTLKPENLTEEFYDYVMLGKGVPEEIEKKTGVSSELFKKLKHEFDYWYPVDLRISGKDLIANHLTFYIFHHVAIFPEEKWPRQIAVNGFLRIEGQPMHKSKGIFISLRDAIEKYGSDATRITLLLAAEGLEDPNWESEKASRNIELLASIYRQVLSFLEECSSGENSHMEEWLRNSIRKRVKKVTEALEEMEIREATSEAIYGLRNDLRWYLRRVSKPDYKTLREAVETWLNLLYPFTPHLAEELWSKLGNNVLLANYPWPQVVEVDEKPLLIEKYLENLIEDAYQILKATGKTSITRLKIVIAAGWKNEAFKELIRKAKIEPANVREVIDLYASGVSREEIGRFIGQVMKNLPSMSREYKAVLERVLEVGEHKILSEAREFLEKEFKCDVEILDENEIPREEFNKIAGKKPPVQPGRPLLLME
ncbi:MAG: leucine--tRNA ligase [Crenarchaeota archaeon]|nr:leucine--tRNA ligase [Thermoproteota archaeon]MDW8033627.1 leucine--tRNA ligase [Nitrososphaerota archaeon]